MGGGAIKKNGVSICSRLPKVAYDVVKAHVLNTLQPHVAACENVLELPGKPDFGDLDVLYVPAASAPVGTSKKMPTVPEIIKAHFGVTDSTHCVRHGPVTSFAFGVKDLMNTDAEIVAAGIQPVEYFQVDFIRCPTATELAMFRFYFGYGDVGGILGRVFNYYGMKFGEAGLWCELFKTTVDELQGKEQEQVPSLPRSSLPADLVATDAPGQEKEGESKSKPAVDPTCTLGRIQLNNDPDAICKYAGLDYSRWCQGFSTVDELVAWLTEDCPFFHPQIFDRLNYEHMQRAQKRPFYIKFLKVIGMSPGKAGPVSQVRRNRQLDAIRHFGQEDRMEELIRIVEVNKMRRSKFSGAMIADGYDLVHTEEHQAAKDSAPQSKDPATVKLLDGKKLGHAIACFKYSVAVKRLFGDNPCHSEAPQPTDKAGIEAAFNTVLDVASAEEIQQEVGAFCATYRPADPQQG